MLINQKKTYMLFIGYAAVLPHVTVSEPSRSTPPRYTLPHVKASFTAGGQLVEVYPNQPRDGQPARVAIHDQMEGQAAAGGSSSEGEELKAFPGPLIK